jgi:predicted transcriptional regulator
MSSLTISPSEWLLLRCIWDLGAATPVEVAEHLQRRYSRTEGLSSKTVGILLARGVEKGLLQSDRVAAAVRGRPPFRYSAAITKPEALSIILRQFIEAYHLEEGEMAEVLAELMDRSVLRSL